MVMSELERNRDLLRTYNSHRQRKKGESLIRYLAAAGVELNQKWDELQTKCNSDGTLDQLTLLYQGRVVMKLSVVWNSDGTIDRIFRS